MFLDKKCEQCDILFSRPKGYSSKDWENEDFVHTNVIGNGAKENLAVLQKPFLKKGCTHRQKQNLKKDIYLG